MLFSYVLNFISFFHALINIIDDQSSVHVGSDDENKSDDEDGDDKNDDSKSESAPSSPMSPIQTEEKEASGSFEEDDDKKISK